MKALIGVDPIYLQITDSTREGRAIRGSVPPHFPPSEETLQTSTILVAFCQGLAFDLWVSALLMKKCFAKPYAPPAKGSQLSRLRRSILALRACGLFLTDRVKPSLWQRLLVILGKLLDFFPLNAPHQKRRKNSGAATVLLKMCLNAPWDGSGEGALSSYSSILSSSTICDPTPANEALCGKINFEL